MKKTITAVVAIALSGSLALAAQAEGDRSKTQGRHAKPMMKGSHIGAGMNLTEDQKAQMKALHDGFRQEHAQFLETVKTTRREYSEAQRSGNTARAEELKATLAGQREQMKQLREAQHEKMLAILTPEQRAQAEARKAERGTSQGMRDGRQGRQGKHGRQSSKGATRI